MAVLDGIPLQEDVEDDPDDAGLLLFFRDDPQLLTLLPPPPTLDDEEACSDDEVVLVVGIRRQDDDGAIIHAFVVVVVDPAIITIKNVKHTVAVAVNDKKAVGDIFVFVVVVFLLDGVLYRPASGSFFCSASPATSNYKSIVIDRYASQNKSSTFTSNC
jgi:hypothetical protein